MIAPDLGLNNESRHALVNLLNALLADEYVLYTKTRNYHWNVTGPHFSDLHRFFETQYTQLAETIDAIAERARALGGRAAGSLAEFLQLARLREQPAQPIRGREMLANLLADHEALIRQLRADLDAAQHQYGDAGTADFLTGLMEDHEKMAWMLRAMLEE